MPPYPQYVFMDNIKFTFVIMARMMLEHGACAGLRLRQDANSGYIEKAFECRGMNRRSSGHSVWITQSDPTGLIDIALLTHTVRRANGSIRRGQTQTEN
jgi:hypothetical protein